MIGHPGFECSRVNLGIGSPHRGKFWIGQAITSRNKTVQLLFRKIEHVMELRVGKRQRRELPPLPQHYRARNGAKSDRLRTSLNLGDDCACVALLLHSISNGLKHGRIPSKPITVAFCLLAEAA